MDGDGEDRPQEIKDLINQSIKDPNKSIVAKRIKRSEGLFFQLLYKFHKLLTLFFTGQNINFGNFTCLTKADVGVLSTRGSLWNSFSGTLKKILNILMKLIQLGVRDIMVPQKCVSRN